MNVNLNLLLKIYIYFFRTGCYPYIKYHCTQRPIQDLSTENRLFKLITIANFGIPCLLYGVAAIGLIKHCEIVIEPKTQQKVKINFLIKEDHQ